MRYFPIFIDLQNRPVIVVGGGEEGLRKVRLLSKTGARIQVIAPSLHDELAANRRVEWLARRFEAGLLDGAALVISADAALNEDVSAAAKTRGIPVNAVDRADLSTFIVPSIVDRAPVVVAIGTEGTAPILGQGLRARIDAMLPPALGKLAEAADQLRARVADAIPAGNRRRSFWQRFFFGDARDSFIAGDHTLHELQVESLLHDEAAPPEGRVSFVDAGPGEGDLLTLRAQRKLQEADVIVHDSFVAAQILEVARRDAVRIPTARMPFTHISSLLVEQAKAGRYVVRLRQGKPHGEEIAAVAAEGITVESVAGLADEDSADIVTFPIREDLQDALLRAAS